MTESPSELASLPVPESPGPEPDDPHPAMAINIATDANDDGYGVRLRSHWTRGFMVFFLVVTRD
jgi:hypothetical protein